MSAAHEHRHADHRAFLYHDPAGFVDGVGAFVHDGLDGGDHVLAVLAPEKSRWLREALGADANAVEFAQADAMYQRHGPMFRAVVGHLERHGTREGGRLRIVAEQALARREPVDVRAYLRYEAASNVVYSGFDASVLCPYDADRLPAEILRDALRTHPEVLENGRARASELFMDPRVFIRHSVGARPAPVGTPPYRLERREDIAGARAHVRAQAEAAGLAGHTVEDFLIAVSEIASNAFLHGHAPRRLWTYVQDDHLVCQVRDAGSGLPDPLAGYLPPDKHGLGGRGLWLAHQLCDIVEVAGAATCTIVSLRVRLPAAA